MSARWAELNNSVNTSWEGFNFTEHCGPPQPSLHKHRPYPYTNEILFMTSSHHLQYTNIILSLNLNNLVKIKKSPYHKSLVSNQHYSCLGREYLNNQVQQSPLDTGTGLACKLCFLGICQDMTTPPLLHWILPLVPLVYSVLSTLLYIQKEEKCSNYMLS